MIDDEERKKYNQRFDEACEAVAKELKPAVEAIAKKRDEIFERFVKIEAESGIWDSRITEFNEIYNGIGYAYVEDGGMYPALTVGFEENVDSFSSWVLDEFHSRGIKFSKAKFRDNALQAKDDIIREIEEQIEKLTNESVSISENWEYSPATVRVELFEELEPKDEEPDYGE